MARKKIREFDGKRLFLRQLNDLRAKQSMPSAEAKFHLPCLVQISESALMENKHYGTGQDSDFFGKLAGDNPWLLQKKLVVKPDMLFGKRGKSGLVQVSKEWDQVIEFVQARMGSELEMGGVKGRVTTFIVEPFVEHDCEFYLCMQANRNGDQILFGDCGGMDVEENWDTVKQVLVSVEDTLSDEQIASLLIGNRNQSSDLLHCLAAFINDVFSVFRKGDYTLLEMNPFTVLKDKDGGIDAFPLDIRVELDSYATFNNMNEWNDIEFPEPWGRQKIAEEKAIQNLDTKSGASLKLSVLNPNGHIWTMVAGGGASVIYADTVVDLGWGDELANYAEYSGNPSTEETYLFAKTLLGLATKNLDGKKRVVLVGGGVANFTDVAATFTGIIQAIKDLAGKLQEGKTKIFVRRGGPNYERGLRLMTELGNEISLPIEVFGPEVNMTKIVELAIEYLKDQ